MKKGSALLVVLGMLSFMLISAVAFSAYMRYARLPSSFLRRSSASRMLAKAALAEAIDEIDAAIGNNPHPGIGTRQPRLGAGSLAADLNGLQNEDTRTRNHWTHRVYIGTNQLHQADDTVSTLTLEGLAYIPPALVNEARYYSRRSMAGVWKPLGFDSGRYAFCAIDVSDHFDANVLAAKASRTSSAGGKISLSYLFETGEKHVDSSAEDPSQWDNFLETQAKVRKMSLVESEILDQALEPPDATYVPFVSVADLNLALDSYNPLGLTSPFCRYIKNGGSDFYSPSGVADASGDKADRLKRLNFVSDGFFPKPEKYEKATGNLRYVDLTDFNEQPFDVNDLTLPNFPVDRLVDNPAREAGRRIADRTSFFGLMALYDYLDANNVPVSLALPTGERAPMICGIGNSKMNTAKLKLAAPAQTKSPASPPAAGTVYTVTQTTEYKIDAGEFSKFIDEGSIKAVFAYPFRGGVDLQNPTQPFKFTLEGQLTVFFSREGAIGFHDGGGLLSTTKNLFTDPGKMDNGVLRIPLKFTGFANTSFNNVQTDADAVREDDAILSMSSEAKAAIVQYLEQTPLLTVVEEWQEEKDPNTGMWFEKPGTRAVKSADSALSVVDAGGTATPLGNFMNGRQEKLVVGSALWLRVKNGNDKTVDLVPASLADDDELNNGNNANAMIVADIVGKTPLMRVIANAGTPLEVSCAALASASATGGSPIDIELDFTMNVQCVDPRWNWAPEHWYRTSAPVTKTTWLSAAQDFVDKDSRDHDIFLATSDAGYLQSVYELAFLPRFTDLDSYGNDQVCGNMDRLSAAFNDFETNPENVKNRHLMWKSYHPFAIDTGAPRDPFEELRLVTEGGGFKVNPYTDNVNVMMGALANTPCGWWAASTTTPENLPAANGQMQYPSQSDRLDARRFNKKYAFNNLTDESDTGNKPQFMWEDLAGVSQGETVTKQGVATELMRLIRQRAFKRGIDGDPDLWTDVFDGVQYNEKVNGAMDLVETLDPTDNNRECLDWDGRKSDFCGVNFSGTDALYDVDRKFLYGYWRECFAARQQLFLIFVRAEPMMMGGGALGATPPQLGARAVALVWRDPAKSPDDQTPHKTRVLFYRQFD